MEALLCELISINLADLLFFKLRVFFVRFYFLLNKWSYVINYKIIKAQIINWAFNRVMKDVFIQKNYMLL